MIRQFTVVQAIIIACFIIALAGSNPVAAQTNKKGTSAKTTQASSAKTAQASSAKPTQTSSAKPTQTSSAKPTQTSSAKSTQASNAKPKQASNAKPTQASSAKPKQTSNAKTTQAASAKSTQAANAKPKQASSAKPKPKNGETPYAYCYGANKKCTGSGCSQIKVITPSNSDVLVTIKQNGKVVAHAYISASSSYTFNVPNGTYQPFFYYGSNWNSNKEMKQTNCGKLRGGFSQNEYFGKDTPQKLSNNVLTYELILQKNGNFSTKPSNRNEAF